MSVIVVIRRHKEYTPWMEINNKIQWWNEIFKIPFLEFRRELSNIAFNNHNDIQADKIYYTIDDFKNDLDSITPQDWILPIDDDDWLCDNICGKIRNTHTSHDMITWRCNILSTFIPKPPDYLTYEGIKNTITTQECKTGMPYSCCYSLKKHTENMLELMRHMLTSNIKREYIANAESCYLVLPQSTHILSLFINSKQELIDSVKEVQLLDENLLSHRPEFVSKLTLVKDLFKQL